MLTPNQIKNHVFTSIKGMYQIGEVDGFMREIIVSYEQMFKENGELLEKLEMLARKLEEYRQDEDKIKDALIVAQKAASQITSEAENKASLTVSDAAAKAEETLSSAKQESETMLADAKTKSESMLSGAESTANEVIDGAKVLADNVISQAKSSSKEIIDNAKVEVEMNQAILNELKAAAASFKADLLEKYHNHIEVINTIPDTVAKDFESSIQNVAASVQAEEIIEQAAAEADEAVIAQAIEEVTLAEAAEEELPADVPVSEVPSVDEEVQSQEYAAYDAPVEEAYKTDLYTDPVQPVEEMPLEEPVQHYVPAPSMEEELKFGEDYDISDDIDEYDEEDEEEERGFRGFFRRKK